MLRTSRREQYVVQPFWMSAKGLRRGEGKRLSKDATQADAMASGARMAETATGVLVIGLEVAEDVDYCGEPRVIASYGEVPRDI